jgi:hypothetical protein
MAELRDGEFRIRFVEGDIDEENIIHDAYSQVVPRLGETVTLRGAAREQTRYRVMGVDHLYDIREGISPENDLTGVWIQIRPYDSGYSLDNI